MKKVTLTKSNFDLWRSISEVHHSILLIRQRELSQYYIFVRQWEVLSTIQDLGSKATLSEIAKRVDREFHVISKQAVIMEKDGLIKRTRNKAKSNRLKIELTEKGLDMIKVGKRSKSIDAIFSFLTPEERQQMESTLKRISIKVQEYNDVGLK